MEEDSEKICTKLLRSIERRHSEVKELLRTEERAALAQAEGLLELLDQQTEDTRRKEAELELLSHTDDHIHFLLVRDRSSSTALACFCNRKISTADVEREILHYNLNLKSQI